MFRTSRPKSTGIYRVCGNISDFKMEIRLRQISHWLPVPKFEYTGAHVKVHHEDNYSESPMSSTSCDFFIYMPYDDHNDNYRNYYDYYNPSHQYTGSSSKISGTKSYTSHDSYASRTSSYSDYTTSPMAGSIDTELNSLVEPQCDDFNSFNRELCNGATANLCISWQQKLFSRAELQRFGDASQCVSPLHRRYHRLTREILEMQHSYQARVQIHQEAFAEEQRVRRCKNKRKAASCDGSQELLMPDDPDFAARTCLVHTLVDADLEEDAEAKKLHSQGYQVMHIYAELQRDTLLFSLRYSSAEGLLFIYPDFSFSANEMEYSLVIDNDSRQLFAFGLEVVTPPELQWKKKPRYQKLAKKKHKQTFKKDSSLPPLDETAEQLLAQYQMQHLLAAERRRLLQFARPPRRTRRVTLLFELREAQHFEYPNIHVRYFMTPPANTLLELSPPDDPFPLRGATVTCQSGGSQNTAHFSHCWQLTLLCEESYQPSELLHIYFEVISTDSWQRERCEGYAHFSCSLLSPLPRTVSKGLRLQCCRPLGNWLDVLNRYFIGGRKLFDFVAYFSSDCRSKVLHTRLELDQSSAMRSTGSLMFSVRKIQQRQLHLGDHLDAFDSEDDCSVLQSKKGLQMSSTLDKVLAAYVDARERIEALIGHRAAL